MTIINCTLTIFALLGIKKTKMQIKGLTQAPSAYEKYFNNLMFLL